MKIKGNKPKECNKLCKRKHKKSLKNNNLI